MRFAMLSDTHYISRRMIADPDDRELALQPAVTEQAVRQAAERSDVLFIIGDLTDSGDRPSHEDFAEFLRSVKAGGKKIYVLFATHDFHHHKAYVRRYGEKKRFTASPWNLPYFDPESVNWKELSEDGEDIAPSLEEAMSPKEIWELYREFGPDDAYSVLEEEFCYCLDLDEKTRCLMLNDSFRNEEALKDLSPSYTPACFRWIRKMADEAKRDGKFLFLCSHHPMLPATPAHRIGAGTRNRDMRSPTVGHTLADMGFSLAFTGHSHFCDVGFLKSPRGSLLCSVTTPSVRFYPPAFRMIELDGQNEILRYDCTYIDKPENVPIEEDTLFEHYHKVFYDRYYASVTGSSPIVKKIMDTATVKDLIFLVKKQAKLTPEEYARISDTKLFDFIIEIAFNMLIGDGQYTPDTPEYRVMMPLCAKLDSIIDTQPFADIRNKFLGGYSISQIIEPMLFNNSAPDRASELLFTKEPEKRSGTPVYTSHAGDVLMAILWLLVIPLSGTAPVLAAAGIPLLTLKKKLANKKHPPEPLLKY